MSQFPDREGIVQLPPCTAACPVGTDARRYVGLIFQGRYEEAMEVITANNVIASVCAYICAHPCEDACRRQYLEGPLAIRALKRFVMDNTREYRRRNYRRATLNRPQRVAIVGSGPAGLGAARELLLQGYPVTLFERDSEPGGMPMHTVPKFRLPRAVVWEDLNELEALGAQFRTGQGWGRDFSLRDLKEQGFAAVLLAIGLQQARDLPVPGMDAAGVYLALPFLRQVAQGQIPPLGRRVLIVGCGNVAMDAAGGEASGGPGSLDDLPGGPPPVVCLAGGNRTHQGRSHRPHLPVGPQGGPGGGGPGPGAGIDGLHFPVR